MRIVGITGKKRSGKDTAATVLVDELGFVRVGFADALKKMAHRVNPIVGTEASVYGDGDAEAEVRLRDVVESLGWEWAKDNVPEVRRLLDTLGTEGVRDIIGEDSWISALFREAARTVPFLGSLVVPDVRFLNEAASLRDGFWNRGRILIIRVVRPDLEDDGDTHSSETEMDQIRPDVTIVNDGTVADLHSKVLSVVNRWKTEAAA